VSQGTASTIASGIRRAHVAGSETRMGTPADYTILVLLVAMGVALWTALDRLSQLQRDVEALKRKAGVEAASED
jgi:hypothetical protein